MNLTGGHSWGLHHHLEEGVNHPRLGGQSHELWLQGQGMQHLEMFTTCLSTFQRMLTIWNVDSDRNVIVDHVLGFPNEEWQPSGDQPGRLWDGRWKIQLPGIGTSSCHKESVGSVWLTMRWTLASYSLDINSFEATLEMLTLQNGHHFCLSFRFVH